MPCCNIRPDEDVEHRLAAALPGLTREGTELAPRSIKHAQAQCAVDTDAVTGTISASHVSVTDSRWNKRLRVDPRAGVGGIMTGNPIHDVP